MSENKTSPCPFCHETRLMHLRGDVGNLHWVYCKTCKAEGPAAMNWEEAKGLWNERPADWVEISPENLKDFPLLPSHGLKVIAFYKTKHHRKTRRVMSHYLEGATEECQFEGGCNCEYSELKDCSYYPEGWYEVVENWDEWQFIPIDGEVTHWMPLPSVPQVRQAT